MKWSTLIRQTHRWVSVAFTVAVIIVTILVSRGEEPAEWVYFLPLLPLALLLLTGLYLFLLPYATGSRAARGRVGREST